MRFALSLWIGMVILVPGDSWDTSRAVVCKKPSSLPEPTVVQISNHKWLYDGYFTKGGVAQLPNSAIEVLLRSHGGQMSAMREFLNKPIRRVDVFGYCDSACAWMVAKNSNKVRLFPEVDLGFHSVGIRTFSDCKPGRLLDAKATLNLVHELPKGLQQYLPELHLTNDPVHIPYEVMLSEYPELSLN